MATKVKNQRPGKSDDVPATTSLLLTGVERTALDYIARAAGVFPSNRSSTLRHCITAECGRIESGCDADDYESAVESIKETSGVVADSGRGSEQGKQGIETGYMPFKLPPVVREQLLKVKKHYGFPHNASAIRLALRVEATMLGFKPKGGWK